MKKHNTPICEIPELTIGLDLSDRTFQFCELNAQGEIVKEGQAKLNPVSLRKYLASRPQARVALEACGQASWVREEIEQLGHEAVVANARELEAVTGKSHRTDRHDARQLARLARADTNLLKPVELRNSALQADLFVIRARAVLVEARTMLINFARGVTKLTGHRLPASATDRFSQRVREAVPETLRPALWPLLNVLDQITAELEGLDESVEALAEQRYPETRWLRQVPGVGTLTALTFVLTLSDPAGSRTAAMWGHFWGWFRGDGNRANRIHICASPSAVIATCGNFWCNART